MSEIYYNVSPRYTCGSPAMVRREIAEQVVAEERHAYQHSLNGIYGEDAQKKAQELGLDGIVEQRISYARHYVALDLITGAKRDSRAERNRERESSSRISKTRAVQLLATCPGIHTTEQETGLTYAELLGLL